MAPTVGLLLFLLLLNACGAQNIETSQNGAGEFDIKINGVSWFQQNFTRGSHVFVTADSQRVELIAQENEYFNGEDVLGAYSGHALQWLPSDAGFKSIMRTYSKELLVVFTQRFQVRICNLY